MLFILSLQRNTRRSVRWRGMPMASGEINATIFRWGTTRTFMNMKNISDIDSILPTTDLINYVPGLVKKGAADAP